ncbi:MAG: hypothetical protein RIR51_1806 [Bacteroidota bacterium]|jgi:ectoine hydroxylase-related dioxygenase (phytanoyl-CoA dioxygenase family)
MKEKIQFFEENGHVYIPSLIDSSNLEVYRKEIENFSINFSKGVKRMEERDTYGKAFLQMMNLWEINSKIKEFVFNPKFAQMAADLLGVKKVRLYHDQALFKEPGGGPTPWHQDQYYWPLDTDKTITMWMPLVDIDDNMGMLTFASKSQNETLPLMKISDDSEKFIEDYVRLKGFEVYAQKSMKAGDATFHRGWTLHKAEGNFSYNMRSVMTIIYMDADAKIIQPKNENQEADRQRWLMGLPIGNSANSKLNPILN